MKVDIFEHYYVLDLVPRIFTCIMLTLTITIGGNYCLCFTYSDIENLNNLAKVM